MQDLMASGCSSKMRYVKLSQDIMLGTNFELHFCKIGPVTCKVHTGVVFLLLGVAWLALDCGFDTAESTLLITGVLLSLFLHSLSHILFALLLGFSPQKLLITPYGDQAKMLLADSTTEITTVKKIVFALSGPALSFILAAALYPYLPEYPIAYALELSSALEGLFLFNAYLFIINLFPVPPLDGHTVIVSLTGTGREATKRLYNVNQILLTLVFLLGFILEAPLLSLIALLVYVQCIKVHFKSQARQIASRYSARDIMTPLESLQYFRHGMPISEARIVTLKSFQQYFPVLTGSHLKGIVNRTHLRALHPEDTAHQTVNEVAEDAAYTMTDTDSISCLLDDSTPVSYPIVVLTSEKDFAGMITHEQFMEWITFHMADDIREEASHSTRSHDDKEEDTP